MRESYWIVGILVALSSPGRGAFGFCTFATTRSSTTRTNAAAGNNANELNPLKPGSTVALITPFDQNHKIDVPSLRKLLQFHIEAQTDNLCLLGTTAEASVLTMAERQTVLQVAVEELKGRIPLLVGTGTINPESVKSMTQQALDCGADASLVVTPYYVKPPQRGLLRHYITAADHYGLPIIMYNVPGRTGVNLLDETIVAALEHPNIVGLKDATGDLQRLQSLQSLLSSSSNSVRREDCLLYSGDDATGLDFVLQGGDGYISVTANLSPKHMHDMFVAAKAGDAQKAKAINQKIELLHTTLFVESNPIPTKWAAHKIGLIASDGCRPPLDALDPQYYSVVEQALRSAQLL